MPSPDHSKRSFTYSEERRSPPAERITLPGTASFVVAPSATAAYGWTRDRHSACRFSEREEQQSHLDPGWRARAQQYHLGRPVYRASNLPRHREHYDRPAKTWGSNPSARRASPASPRPGATWTPSGTAGQWTVQPAGYHSPPQRMPSESMYSLHSNASEHPVAHGAQPARCAEPTWPTAPAQPPSRKSVSPLSVRGAWDEDPALGAPVHAMADSTRSRWSLDEIEASSSHRDRHRHGLGRNDLLSLPSYSPAQPDPSNPSWREAATMRTSLKAGGWSEGQAQPDGVKVTKRKKVSNACTNCQRSSKGCSSSRPCARCIRLGMEDTCQSSVHQKRRARHMIAPTDADERPKRESLAVPPGGQTEWSSSSSLTSYSTAATPYVESSGVRSTPRSSDSLGHPASRPHSYHLDPGQQQGGSYPPCSPYTASNTTHDAATYPTQ